MPVHLSPNLATKSCRERRACTLRTFPYKNFRKRIYIKILQLTVPCWLLPCIRHLTCLCVHWCRNLCIHGMHLIHSIVRCPCSMVCFGRRGARRRYEDSGLDDKFLVTLGTYLDTYRAINYPRHSYVNPYQDIIIKTSFECVIVTDDVPYLGRRV